MADPVFDPSKPYEELPASEPVFDPNAPFEEVSAAPSDSALENALEATAGATTGATIGAAIPGLGGMAVEKVGQLGQRGVEALSPYTPEQLSNMTENIEQFKGIQPQETFEKAGAQFENLNKIANEKEREAYANLVEPLSRQEFEQTVSQAAIPYTKDVPQDTPEFLSAQEKLTPKIERPNPIQAQEAAQLEAYAEKQAKQRMADVKAANMGMIPEEQLLETYKKAKADALKSKEGFAFVPDAKAAQAALDKEAADVAMAGVTGTKKAVEKFQTPLASKLPALKGKMFKSADNVSEGDIIKVLNQYAPGEKLVGEEPYKLVRKIRAMAYDKNDNLRISGDAAKAVQKQLRELVGDKNPEASELFQSMSQDIQQLEKLEKAGYLKRDMDVSKNTDEFINFGEKQQQQVMKDIAPNLYNNKVAISDDAAQRLIELKKVLPEPLFKEVELAALKQAFNDPKRQLRLSAFDIALAPFRPSMAALGLGVKAARTAEGSLTAYRAAKALQKAGQSIGKKTGAGAVLGGVLGGPLGAMAGEVAGEALDVEPSGATPEMPDYWLEKGVRNPEEQVQRASLAGFKEGLPNEGRPEMPGPYDKPSVKANRERMFEANKTDKKNYVEKLETTDSNDIQNLINSFQGMDNKAAAEYSNVLSKVMQVPENQKDAILFGLNQQPAFRELLRKAKV